MDKKQINLKDKHIKCIDKNCDNYSTTVHPLLGCPLCKYHSQKKFVDALTDGFKNSGWKK